MVAVDTGDGAVKIFRQIVDNDEVVQLAVRIGLLALLIYWSVVLVQPFIPILAWGVVLAVALHPAYLWVVTAFRGRRRLASAFVVLCCLAVIIGPVAWLGVSLVEGVKNVTEDLTSANLVLPALPQSVKNWPMIGPWIDEFWTGASANIAETIRNISPHLKPLATSVLALAGSVSVGTLKFIAAIVLAGFILPSGPTLVSASRNFLTHIVPDRSEAFVALIGSTIRTISQGVIGIAMVQALFIGIGLKLVGVPNAGLLAFLCMVLGIVQIGAGIIILPVIIWLWMTKDFTTALPATIYFVVAGLADNVAKPMLMGRGMTTPMLVIFLGLLGGTIAHGIVGLFVGPIILAVVWELMKAWVSDSRAERDAPDDGTPAD